LISSKLALSKLYYTRISRVSFSILEIILQHFLR